MMVNKVNHEVKIRRACVDDVPIMVNLLADDELGSQREDYTTEISQEYYSAFAKIDADENNYLIVMEYDGVVIGSLQLTIIQHLNHKGSRRGHVESVHIDQKYRGKGLGRALIQWAIDKSRELNCNIVQLTSNKKRTQALQFYEKIGFTASHEGFKLYL